MSAGHHQLQRTRGITTYRSSGERLRSPQTLARSWQLRAASTRADPVELDVAEPHQDCRPREATQFSQEAVYLACLRI